MPRAFRLVLCGAIAVFLAGCGTSSSRKRGEINRNIRNVEKKLKRAQEEEKDGRYAQALAAAEEAYMAAMETEDAILPTDAHNAHRLSELVTQINQLRESMAGKVPRPKRSWAAEITPKKNSVVKLIDEQWDAEFQVPQKPRKRPVAARLLQATIQPRDSATGAHRWAASLPASASGEKP